VFHVPGKDQGRQQYQESVNKDGAWRKIRLKVNPPKGLPNLSVRGKSGYYAPALESKK
jgi:hypothetical protein